jgi:hypothetical protein
MKSTEFVVRLGVNLDSENADFLDKNRVSLADAIARLVGDHMSTARVWGEIDSVLADICHYDQGEALIFDIENEQTA